MMDEEKAGPNNLGTRERAAWPEPGHLMIEGEQTCGKSPVVATLGIILSAPSHSKSIFAAHFKIAQIPGIPLIARYKSSIMAERINGISQFATSFIVV